MRINKDNPVKKLWDLLRASDLRHDLDEDSFGEAVRYLEEEVCAINNCDLGPSHFGIHRCLHGVEIAALRELMFAGRIGLCQCCENLFGCFTDAEKFCHQCQLHRLSKGG